MMADNHAGVISSWSVQLYACIDSNLLHDITQCKQRVLWTLGRVFHDMSIVIQAIIVIVY